MIVEPRAAPRPRPARTAFHLLTAGLVPLLVALPPLFWVAEATRRSSYAPLGRDQGIFQYVAFALGRGAIDYRDVRDVNGPLTHVVHLAFLALGGADEHRFRVLDLGVAGFTFAFAGACLPGLVASTPLPPRDVEPLERAFWALAGWVVLSSEYLSYKYWDLAQRESFCDWFLLPSVALQLALPRLAPKHSVRLLGVVGALSVVPWFAKPTYILMTLAQLAAVALDCGCAVPLRRRLGAFVAGGLGCALVGAGLLAWFCDLPAYLRIQFGDVPAYYRFIWSRTTAELLTLPWSEAPAALALLDAAVLLALIALGELPTRVFAVALLPVCALVGVVLQSKGFPYHFHPVTAGIHLQWLVLLVFFNERTRNKTGQRTALRLVPAGAAAALALWTAFTTQNSSSFADPYLLYGARVSAETRASRAYLDHFVEADFFPFDLRQAAAYLRSHTGPNDQVQTYGMDPYVLFLAGRLSATPYIYDYDLNADAALASGSGGARAVGPDDLQAARIRALRDGHEADLTQKLKARPPAAFVFFDNAPLLSAASAWDDFAAHCPAAASWVALRYREAARFGQDVVWLRRDLPD